MTDKINDGGPAYPFQLEGETQVTVFPGMSKREVFAMAAMQGLMASGEEARKEHVAPASVWFADALLAELAKGADQ